MTMRFDATSRDLAERLFRSIGAGTRDSRGITRPSYGHGESFALHGIRLEAIAHGLVAETDRAGNLIMTIDGAPKEPVVLVGSHLDSVPEGGNYDGLAGVIAALLVLIEAKKRGSVAPIAGIGFRGEESAWFGTPYVGSRAALGLLEFPAPRPDGTSLKEAMRAVGADVDAIEKKERLLFDTLDVGEFWELHIEQGPVLVDVEIPVGVVDAIRGNVRAPSARVLGKAGHSGTTPHAGREDAVLRFAQMLTGMDEDRAWVHERGRDVTLTCGIVGTVPGKHAMTTIADEVRFSMDVRSVDPDVLDFMVTSLREWNEYVDWGGFVRTPPAEMSPEMIARAIAAADRLGVPYFKMPSGAGHDAATFAGTGISSGMIFVRNENGSHNPDEMMDMDDFMLGVEVLYEAIQRRGSQ